MNLNTTSNPTPIDQALAHHPKTTTTKSLHRSSGNNNPSNSQHKQPVMAPRDERSSDFVSITSLITS